MSSFSEVRFLSTLLPFVALFLVASYSPLLAEQSEDNLAPQPRVSVKNPVFDFSEVRQGEKIEHAFEISNIGPGVLTIGKIHPACGCTVADLERNTLATNESTSIKVVFDTTGFQGAKTKTVRIFTNDPQQSSVVLTLRGTVRADVTVKPQVIEFGSVLHGQAQLAEALVLTEPGVNIALLDLESRSPELEASWSDVVEGNRKGKKIALRLKENVPVGTFRSRIVVKTSSERTPILNIPVLASVEGDLQLSPTSISFGLLSGPLQEMKYETAMVSNRSTKELEVLEVTSDNPLIVAEFSRLDGGEKYAIRVGISTEASGVVRGRVRISTNHPEAPQRELVLPVYAIVKRGED